MKQKNVRQIILQTLKKHILLTAGMSAAVIGAILFSLLPPLVLADIIDRLTEGESIAFSRAFLYFALLALTGIFDSSRETLLTVLGQKITHALRSGLSEKLNALPAETLNKQEPGAVVSRFVGDVDTIENLFTSGIISMFADACRILSILIIIFSKSRGLAILLCVLLPLLYLFTRHVQKRMLKAHVENRAAVSSAFGQVPETIRCIRTIHTLNREGYMKKRYDRFIGESYAAIEKTNFYDAVYSPIILVINALVVSAVMLLTASGNPVVLSFFGISVGTAVALINYISQIFSPIESLGMEIQTIQSAFAGVRRINEFLGQPEQWEKADRAEFLPDASCVELKNVCFGYDDRMVLKNIGFSVKEGEQVTFVGRTGAGKSTIFRLLLGLYRPQLGSIKIFGMDADRIPDREKRRIFGYVEQTFHPVPGTVADQISMSDPGITREMAEKAAVLAGLHETILGLEKGYDTPCTPGLFSQGQWQLLAIARAVAAQPKILLLDEITANLDADTEARVLEAVSNAAADRTVFSISHRIYTHLGGRIISIGS